jgi:hypothetical protein
METGKKWFDDAHHGQAKKSFLIVSLIIMLISGICGTAEAREIYAGGNGPNIVYRYLGGTSWEAVSQELDCAVLCLCEYRGQLYAGTGGPGESCVGKVWRYGGGTEWTLVGDNLDDQVCSLVVFRGNLYAGTAYGAGRLYRYDNVLHWTKVVEIPPSWDGFKCMYVWNDLLYIGDIEYDIIGHYDGNSFKEVWNQEPWSCIWDFEVYDSNLYASDVDGRVFSSPDVNWVNWIMRRNAQIPDISSWELETFQGYLYVTTGPKLERYDGNNFNLVWTQPNGYEIISMINAGNSLIFGTGREAGSRYGIPGIGRIYAYDGSAVHLISGDMGDGIQSLYAGGYCWVELNKVDDVNDGKCVVPGDDVNYTISYNYQGDTNCPDIYDVNIIDELPEEVEFISASSNGTYNRCSHTVTWNIGTLHPGDSGFVTLKVKVKCAEPGETITNRCEIRSGEQIFLRSAYEYTPVCSPTLTKVDNVPDGNCVGPGDNITYNICYNANGYRDTDVVIVDELPGEVEPNNTSDPNYDSSSHTYTWNIGTLEPNESGCVTLTVKVKYPRPGGVITNFCEMRGNCMTSGVTACEDTPVCNLTLTKVDNITGCVNPGSNIIYDINYAANGYGDTNVIIIDELPYEVNYVSSDPCGAYNPDNRTITWNIGTLKPNESGFRKLTVKVNYLGPGSTIRNKCEIRSDEQILRSAYEYTPKCGCSADPCMIKLDFNVRADNNEPNTQPGFTKFILENSGSEVNGVVIDLGGNLNTDRRDGPYGTWVGDPPVYYPRAGERIYRDFIYSPWPGGVTITLWGLGVNRVCDISIYSFDDLSIPRRLANWTANGNYLLTTDFNGGMINWPGYEGQKPEDLYKYAFTGTATTDYLGRIILESIAYPICGAAGRPFAFVNALTVVPIGTFIPTKYAQRPVPFDGTQTVPVNTILKWRKGGGVSKHDLYLGTNFNDVNNATRASHPGVLAALDLTADANKVYDPYGATGFLKLDTTYYWRVDENSPPSYKGEVWGFKTLPYSVVDDFESYGSDDALKAVWTDYWVNGSCAEVFLEQTIFHSGYQSMEYQYKNYTYYPYYSEANATIGTGTGYLNIDPNWSGMEAKALSLWFYGDPCNPVGAHDKMYIKLVDSATPEHNAKVYYSDTNDVQKTKWQEWNIPLTDFTADNPSFNLRKVKNIIIGFGDGTQAASDGNIFFDHILLYTTRCVLAKRSADFAKVDYAPSGSPAGDCVIDYQELKMMVDDWLMASPPVNPKVDLYNDHDCMINFKDFAILANKWLEEDMFP